ncbi:AGE family epimerase/isomerase [Parvularcula marina]|uniref:Mannose-6-phosphate isomerase n=1 Tax=Parvularcula marina TaxID=2292771 RepID=A0A371RHH8_9PROT|nr:AGE family epimerase/isomerase [Parvularcula marina]RFB04900.1 mannose-6-phosphate isomerase [Parvularcula marina]
MAETDLISAAARLKDWLVEAALPLWANAALDPEGGYYEDLTPQGAPRKDQIRRVRVQPRQAYVYAHAAHLGWSDQARAFSDHGFDYLLSRAAFGDPLDPASFDGFAHRLHPDGSVADPRRDTYDHAFVLLACAWRIRAFRDDRSRQVAKATLGFLDRECGQPDGSFLEGRPHQDPRRQNPHMHLFEAFMALFEATEDDANLERARRVFALFQTHFLDTEQTVLREFFQDDWQLSAEKGHLIEPGHMMEWCWLLDQYEALTGEDMSELIRRLYTAAEPLGLEPQSGFLVDCVSLEPSRPIPPARRTWVQTEYIKATLVRSRRGETAFASKAASLINRLFGTYLKSDVPGGYTDRYGADGEVISDAMPVSTLYHLMSLGAEADRTVKALG